MTSRRSAIKQMLGTAAAFAVPNLWRNDRPYLDVARQAAAWIRHARQTTPHGLAWPVDPLVPSVVDTESLYTGTPGVVLFLLELHRATGDESALRDALGGADHLIATPATKELGLYVGLGGLAYMFELVYRASGQQRYRDAAKRCVAAIGDATSDGKTWGASNDIISGVAGTGLFLLWCGDHVPELRSQALILATRAGDVLLERAQATPAGLQWQAGLDIPYLLPNFSHGTAGVAYFLASLHRRQSNPRALDAARAGARQLLSIATTANDTCTIYHDDRVSGRDLYYLGWCHGPVGTTRLFSRLGQVTDDPQWTQWVHRGARGIMLSGIPEQRTPGFWNNVSMCCGNAGVAHYFADLARANASPAYRQFAHRVTVDLLQRSTTDATGTRWFQAENRVDPNGVVAQTGYMQGAAGMGTLLLHLDGLSQGRAPFVTLPDAV